ncbi:MAG: AraC family transcriptional regulator [Balneolales bacterium]|nr:AraC family transcriptional regulator [Balneolales bacterium]
MPQLLPYPKNPQKLVENRRSFGGNDVEFSIYDTYQQAEKVELQAGNPLYCGMITGRKVIHTDKKQSFNFLPNESLVVPSDQKIWIDFPEAFRNKPTQCITIEIDRYKVKEIVARLNENFPRMPDSEQWKYDDSDYVKFENTQRFNENLDQIINCFTDSPPYRDMLIDLNTSRLIIHMLQSEARKVLLERNPGEGRNSALSAVLKFIKENINRRISMAELEKVACMSKATLFRHFKNELGLSPIDFVNQERMKKARQMLLNGMNVTETCYALGYKSLPHFSDMFKSVYGKTPVQLLKGT